MKAQRLPQERILFDALANFHKMWGKITFAVKGFVKTFLEGLLEDELSAVPGADRYERSTKRKGYRNGHYLSASVHKYSDPF